MGKGHLPTEADDLGVGMGWERNEGMKYIVGAWNDIKGNTPVLIVLIICILIAFVVGTYFAAHDGLFQWIPSLFGVN